MMRTRCLHWGRAVSVLLLLVGWVGSSAVGQVRFRHPQPGDIYKEYSRTMMEYYEWRVTDPNATSVWIPDPSYLVNTVLPITIDDLNGAIRAEAVIDLWQGHAGTTGKKMKVNGHDWITIPELKTTPGNGQCWLSQSNVVVDVPLDHLVQGTNYFEGSNEGQTCYSNDWGQHGWYGIIFRIYYNSSKAHPTGSITSPGAGDSFGEKPTVTATAAGGAGIRRVDFLAYYDGLDTDGDGVYQDWHYYYHRLQDETEVTIKDHVGTAWSEPYVATWNTDWVPDQAAGAVKIIARIQDNNGVWFVTDPVENLTLQRSGAYVRMFKSRSVPEYFYLRANRSERSYIDIPDGTDLSAATAARFVISTWNGICGGKQPSDNYFFRVNGWYAPEFGKSHFWSLDYLNIPASDLNVGTNTFEVFSESQSTGLYIHWPGPQIVVRFGGDPVPVQLSSFTGKSLGAAGVLLEWTTLSETNNYGFEVQKSDTRTGSYTTIPRSFTEGHGTTIIPHKYSFTDPDAAAGVRYYRLKQINLDQTFSYSEPMRVDATTGIAGSTVPTRTMLAQNYPNPFNPRTVIRYGVAEKGQVTLDVYNALGEIVARLVNGERMPGYYDVPFNADGLAAGVYFYRLSAGRFVQTNKLILLR
jgi:hypothetical protein